MGIVFPRFSDAQHGFYAEALRAHLPSLVTRAGLGTISRSSGVARFVQGGVVKTFRCPSPKWLSLATNWLHAKSIVMAAR